MLIDLMYRIAKGYVMFVLMLNKVVNLTIDLSYRKITRTSEWFIKPNNITLKRMQTSSGDNNLNLCITGSPCRIYGEQNLGTMSRV